jgi:hypothetical protein
MMVTVTAAIIAASRIAATIVIAVIAGIIVVTGTVIKTKAYIRSTGASAEEQRAHQRQTQRQLRSYVFHTT